MQKRLYIIAGITGAIGNALLSKLLQDEEVVVYGISRKGLSWEQFVDTQGTLHTKTFLCSATDMSTFVSAINTSAFSSITYVHALGHYPFEVNAAGTYELHNDEDGDGVDDLTHELTYTKFVEASAALVALRERTGVRVACTLFGSLADEHEPQVHRSWWRTMEKVKEYMRAHARECGMHVVNISSVLCTHELLSRPFVFTATDADPKYWLAPHDLAESLCAQFQSPSYFKGFDECAVYNHNPAFKNGYYSDSAFTKRKVLELYGTRSAS